MSSPRLYLLKPGGLGVTLIEDGIRRTLEKGFSTPDGLEELMGALPLEQGDVVGMSASPGDAVWQDALEALLLRDYPGILPLTHELALRDGNTAPEERAPCVDIYCYIDYGIDEVSCVPVLVKGAPPGVRAFPLPAGPVYALRLIAARLDGAPWIYDAQAGCAHPGRKELARSTLCLVPVDLVVSADQSADLVVDLKPGGEIDLTLRVSEGEDLRILARRVLPPFRV
jgi:hypothetical protein